MTCRQVSKFNGITGSGRTGGGGYATEAECNQACREGACCDGANCTVKPQCQCVCTSGSCCGPDTATVDGRTGQVCRGGTKQECDQRGGTWTCGYTCSQDEKTGIALCSSRMIESPNLPVFKGVGTTCTPSPCKVHCCVFESWNTSIGSDGYRQPSCLSVTQRQCSGLDPVTVFGTSRTITSGIEKPTADCKGCTCRPMCLGIVPCELLVQYDLNWPAQYAGGCGFLLPGGSRSGSLVLKSGGRTSSGSVLPCGPNSYLYTRDCGNYGYSNTSDPGFSTTKQAIGVSVSRASATEWTCTATVIVSGADPAGACGGGLSGPTPVYTGAIWPNYASESEMVEVAYPPPPQVFASPDSQATCYIGITIPIYQYIQVVFGDGPQGGFGRTRKLFNVGTVSIVDAYGEYTSY